MRIKSLQLNNVGVFENELIEFKPCPDKKKAEIHIFTGTNGTGKSTILKAIASSFEPYREMIGYDLSQNEIYKYFRQYGKYTPTFEDEGYSFNSTIENSDFADYVYAKQDHRRPVRKLKYCAFAYSGSRKISSKSILKSDNFKSENALQKVLNFEHNENQNFLLLEWLRDSLLKRAYAKTENLKLKEELHNDIIKSIEEIIYQITGKQVVFKLDDNLNNTELILDNTPVRFEALSDGVISIISWIADLFMRLENLPWKRDIPIFDRNIILLLDEIEIHLHIEWQRKILPVIQKLFPNAQIFISTHSPFVVNSVDDAWVYNLEVEKGNAKVRKVELSQDGKSFTNVLRNIFGVKETYGPAVENDLKKFRNLISKALNKEINKSEDAVLVKLAKSLAQQSPELESVIGFELRQLERLNKKEVVV